MSEVSRRSFLGSASAGLGAGVLLNGASSVAAETNSHNGSTRPPREVWVASLGHMDDKVNDSETVCRRMLERMEEVAPLEPDIICTPELFAYFGVKSAKRPVIADRAEEKSGPILDRFSRFAAEHRCYVICSTLTKEAGRCYNSAVLLDRNGRYVGEYRKAHPTGSELELGVTPGPLDPPVFETDLGTIGMQICFDVNWYEDWSKLSRKGAEIVFWPSAFAGGMMLNSLAWMNKFYVVGSTLLHPTKIVDPLGQDVVSTGRAGDWVCAPINLDVAVVQGVANFKKFEAIREKYGRQFHFRVLHIEALATVERLSGDVSVAEVLAEFDIPTSKEQFASATKAQDALRPVADV